MNHVYRIKRNGAAQHLQPVPETARNAGKGRASAGKTLGQVVALTVASFALSGVAALLHAQQAPPAASALPQGGVVSRGSATIATNTTPAGSALMAVNQSTTRAVIDWASFNVGSNAKVLFNQPSSSSVVLNQILGNNASQIYGQISANGQVFLSNPNGVYFSPTAQVNVGGLVATTGRTSADDFMAGKVSFNREGATGSVVNDGQLNAALGGYIALLAPEVRNQGVVVAQAGTVAFASAETIALTFNSGGTGLAGITTTAQTIAALVENRSAVLAEGGQIILSAHALANLQGAVVKNSGQLSATSLTSKGGKIVLMGDSIVLSSTSKIEASGATGGGTVLVGGDWQGSGDMRQATQVAMAQGASIEANATSQGVGGKVVLWSDVKNANSVTQVGGRIEAKGAGTGNGGQVETSGHTLQLGEQVTVDTQAASQGKSGQWLLDPADITISSSADAGATNSGGSYTPNSGVATSVVNATTLQTALNSGNVTVSTTNTGTAGSGTGNITVSSNLTWASANVLTLQAAGGISVSGTGNISMTSTTAGAGVVFNLAGNSNYTGFITGNATANATLTKMGAGTLTLSGSTNEFLITTVSSGVLKLGSAAALGRSSNGSITVLSGAALDLFAQSPIAAIPLSISGTGVNNGGALMNSSATIVAFGGLLSLGADASIVAGSGVIRLTHAGTILGSGFNLTLGGTATGSYMSSILGTGTGTLTKQGTGTWALNGANTFTGTTTIVAGTLTLGNVDALGSGTSGGVTVNDGAALDLGASKVVTVLKPLTLNGTGVSNGGALRSQGSSTYSGLVTLGSDTLISGPVTLSNTGTITGDGKTLTLDGSTGGNLYSVLGTGTGGLIKQGTGTWSLRSANTYSGATTVNGGDLDIYNNAALGSTASGTTVNAGATLSLYSGTAVPENITLNGGTLNNASLANSLQGNVVLAANSFITGQNTLTINGNISGPGGFSKDSAATSNMNLILAGNNSYTGSTAITSGSLKLGSATALGASSQVTVTNLAFGGVLASSGVLDMNGYSVNAAIPLSLQGPGPNNGALTNTSATPVTYAGLVSIVGTTYIGTSASGGAITLSNTGTITGTNTPVLGLSGNGVLNSVIGSTITDLIKTTSGGSWVLTRDNTYTGSTTIANGSTLQIGNGSGSASLPSATNITIGAGAKLAYNLPAGAVLTNAINFGDTLSTIANLGYGSALDLSGATLTYTSTGGTYSPSVNETVSTPTVASIVLPASPDLGKTKFNVTTTGFQSSFSSTPTVTWTGTSTGSTQALLLNGAATLAFLGEQLTMNANSVTIASGAVWSLNNNGAINYYATTTDTVSAVLVNGAVITVTPRASVTNNGVFSGSGAWSLVGSGSLTLGGSNTYSGTVTVFSGNTLKAGRANAFGTGYITVNTGAALDLNGQTMTSAGNLTLNGTGVNNGGALMNSAGAATYPGLVILGSSSKIVADTGAIALTNTGTTTGANSSLTLGGAAGGSFAGAISTTGGNVTKQDAGTWVLSGSNTYTGGTFINGGTLQISSDGNLGNAPGTAATNITINGGTLAASGQPNAFNIQSTRSISIGSLGGTISNNGGYLVSVNGAITSSGSVTVNGGDIAFSSINVSNASPILVKTTGTLTQKASTSVTSAGGSITYWSDSDGNGDGAIAILGGGTLGTATQINSNGGTIVMGGGAGASAAGGYARGQNAIVVGSYSTLQAGSGSITLYGMSNDNNGSGVVIGSGSVSAANVTITGYGYDNASLGSTGVRLSSANVSASNLLTINGTGGGTGVGVANSGANDGVFIYSSVVESTGTGNVVINATGGGRGVSASNRGLYMQAALTDSTIRSVSGTVTVNAVAGASSTPGGSVGFSTTLSGVGSPSGEVRIGGGATQTGATTLRSDSWSFDASPTGSHYTLVQSAGPVTLEPVSASFSAAGLNLSYVDLGNTISSLTLGKVNNTGPVYVGPASVVNFPVNSYSVAGPISIYGDITLGTPLATTGTGANGLVTLSGNVSEVQYGKLTAPSLLLAGTGASNVNMSSGANALGTLAGSGLATVNIETGGPAASGAMTVGTLGVTAGLTSSGPVTLSTYVGNLTLANDIVTTNTGASAVTLNAGTVAIALGNNGVGNTTSGNVVLGGGTITTGTGGRARVYTGSIADSTGLGALVGSGSGRFRYGSTAATTNYTTALGNSGIYAIYRERPTVTWTTSPNQSIAYGATPVSPTAGVVAGLANGDLIDTAIALRLASDNSLATTNANGFYNVESYFYSRTEGAKGLGYLVSNPTLTVGRATVTVTANDATKTYDGLAYSGGNGVSYSGFAAGDTAGNAFKGSLTYWGASQGAVNADTYAITPGGLALSGYAGLNYTIAYANGTLTVAKAPLTVRINNDARFLTETDAAGYMGASYAGFVAGQTATVLGGTLAITRTGGNTLAGTYTGVLAGSGLTAANYSFNYVRGNYTIVPADQLLVKFANAASTYASDPLYTVTSAKYLRSSTNSVVDLTARVQINGSAFSLNDGSGGTTSFTLGATSPSLSRGGQLNVGAYQLGASGIVTNANYSNTMTLTGALQVNTKAVTGAVTSSASKAYDGTTAMNVLTLGVTGATVGDAVGASGAGAYAAKDVGTGLNYSVKNIVLTGADARNYWLTDSITHAASNSLTGSNGIIAAVPLTVTASNDSKTYDGNAYSGGKGVTFSGFMNNETAVDLGGALAYGGTSQTATNAGTYSIIPSGYTSTNYTIAYGNGTLTISPMNVTVIVGALQGSVSKQYNGNRTATLASANYLLTGWVGSDGATVTQTNGTYDTATAGTNKTVTVTLTDADYAPNVGTRLSNYNLPTTISGPVGVISAKPVVVTNTARATTYDATSTYGVLTSGTAFTTSAMVLPDGVVSVTQTPSGAGVTLSGVAQAGSFGVTPSNAVLGVGNASNYSFSYVDSAHTVNKANLTLAATASITGNVYNGGTFTGSYSLNALGNDASNMTVTGVATGTNVGTYPSTLAVTGTALSNYNTPVVTDANLVISARPVTVSADNKSKSYGEANPTLTYTVAADGTGTSRGLVNGDSLSGNLSTTATQSSAVNTYTIDASALSNGNYLVTANNGTLTINKAHLTVNADNKTKIYGDANPALSATVSGFVNGENLASSGVTGAGAASTAATTSTGVGSAAITPTVGSLAAGNYDFTTFLPGTLTITQRPLTVSADDKSKTYGDANPALTYTVAPNGTGTSRGLVNGDSLSGNLSTTATQSSAVNTYTIDASALSNGNYLVTANNGTLTINKAHLTVNADNKTKIYGDANPALSATVSGFVNGENLASSGVTGAGAASTAATTSTGVGSAAITPTVGSLAAGNYDFTTFLPGTLTITQRPLTVSADDKSKTYGDANPALTYTVAPNGTGTSRGLVNGDSLNGNLSTTATPSSAVGNYTIDASALANGNYALTVNNGTLTIGAANITVQAISGALRGTVSKVYDGTTLATLAPENYLLTGWVGQEGATVTKTVGAYDTANAGSGIKVTVALTNADYRANAGTSLSNYRLPASIEGLVGVIGKAHLTVTADGKSKVYGDVNPTLTTTVSGFVNGENLATSGVTGAGLASTSASRVTGVSSVAVTPAAGTLAASNYDFTTFIPGTLTITQRPVTVTADNQTKTYGNTNPVLTYTVAADGSGTSRGLVNGDSLGGSPRTDATQSSAVGSYTIDASTLANGNYLVTANNGTLTITKAPLTVRVNNDARFVTLSDTVGYAGATYLGLVGGETASVLAGNLVISRTGADSLPGTYAGVLSGSGLSSGNYTISYVPGDYTIVPAHQLLVRVGNSSATYGAAPTYSVTEAKYLSATSGTIVDLTSQVQQTSNNVLLTDGTSASTSFTLGPVAPATSTAGKLAVGAYQISPVGVSNTNANYSNNLTVVGALQVNAAPLTLSAGAAPSKVYDGTTSMGDATLNVTGAQPLDRVAATGVGSFSSKAAGSGVNYTVANISLSGSDAPNYYLSGTGTVSGSNGTIRQAPLLVNVTASDKVYDGTTGVVLATSDNRIAGDVLTVSTQGNFVDKNVGTAKTVNVAAASLTGADAANYSVSSNTTTTASITRLPQVTWVGGASGNWFDPANWAAGAVPDLSNVANVLIPAGVSVSFSNAVVAPAQVGPVSIQSLGSGGSLSLSAGTLNIGNGGLALDTLAQSGGSITSVGAAALGSFAQSAGSLEVSALSTTTGFNQTGSGTLTASGNVQIGGIAGTVSLGNIATNGDLVVNNTGGAIVQSSGTVLGVAGSSTFNASVNGVPADVSLANATNRLVGSVTASRGNLTVADAVSLTATVDASGTATLSSGGDLFVSGNANALITNSAGATRYGVMTVAGRRIGNVDSPVAPPSIAPKIPVVEARAYVVKLLSLPDRNVDGVVRVDWHDTLAETQVVLPLELRDWIQLTGATLKLDAAAIAMQQSVALSQDASTLRLSPQVAELLPVDLVLQSPRGSVVIRILKVR